ncbi:hypothetical protein [Sphingomonas sp. 3-13AW]|uniref:hypothetical protein n=1 Tax=Sphingomonas sp. 3-13AW TaxID=3050450 RepID=UPI003BB57B5E
MLKEFRVMARTTSLVEIARFQAEGDALDARVSAVIRQARTEGDLKTLATGGNGPVVVAQQLGEGDALGHPGEPAVDQHFAYDVDGRPLDQRQTRISTVKGSHILEGSRDNGHTFDEVIGAFNDEARAERIASFWKAGHLG